MNKAHSLAYVFVKRKSMKTKNGFLEKTNLPYKLIAE